MEDYNEYKVFRNDDGSLNYERYLLNGKRHRIGKPAYIAYWSNNAVEYEEYAINGLTHRVDGPAKISYFKNGSIHFQEFVLNGFRHRADGPAYIEYRTNGKVYCERYYLFNRQVTKKEFETPGFIDVFILEHS